MCKELSSIGSSNIKVEAQNFHIDFTADADEILKRKVRLGENDYSDDDSDIETPTSIYKATFTPDQLTRINKISGLSNSIQIYPGNEHLPLLFRTRVGKLGKISIYIKSKELIETEKDISDDSDSD